MVYFARIPKPTTSPRRAQTHLFWLFSAHQAQKRAAAQREVNGESIVIIVETTEMGGRASAAITTNKPNFLELNIRSVKRHRNQIKSVPKKAAGVLMAAVSDPVKCSERPPKVKFARAIIQAISGPLL